MQDNRSQFAGPAFVFGVIVGAAIGVLAANPKTQKWVKDKAEWARTDGKEALGHMKEHTHEAMEAVRGSARAIKEDARTLKQKSKNATNTDEIM